MSRASRLLCLLALGLTVAGGCEKTDKDEKDTNNETTSDQPAANATGGVESADILAREQVTDEASVKHVLIGWKDLAKAYGGRMDPRAKERTKEQADKLALEIAAKLKSDPSKIDALIKDHGEDPGAKSGDPYDVTPTSRFVPEFKKLALRLKENEVGIVKTNYGYHVMLRMPPPPLDPLESADILARKAAAPEVRVQHVLIGWKDVPAAKQRPLDPRAAARTKAEADELAKQVLEKIKGGADMAALMKEYSEDPGSKDNARVYELNANTPMVPSFKKLSMRLQEGEAGMVISPYGWHVIKRVPPAPPDPLESADILARDQVTEKAKVKHILLGWKDTNAGDPRAVKRTRAELDKLVKATVAKLKKGDAIEPLMKELSEDPGSAKSGNSYDATPTAGLVAPFKALSLRLNVGEVGVVKTQFGFHIIKRVE